MEGDRDMELRITVESGICGDGFNVHVTDGGKQVFQEKYRYGYNVSASRADAIRNERDRELAVTCHWERIPCEKPYVKDLIRRLCETYGVSRDRIRVESGTSVFRGTPVAVDRADAFISEYL